MRAEQEDVLDETAPTSNATTAETEPGVVAAISSAEGGGQPLSFSSGTGGMAGLGRPLILLAAAAVLGYAAARWLRASP